MREYRARWAERGRGLSGISSANSHRQHSPLQAASETLSAYQALRSLSLRCPKGPSYAGAADPTECLQPVYPSVTLLGASGFYLTP